MNIPGLPNLAIKRDAPRLRRLLSLLGLLTFSAACSSLPETGDPRSDFPEVRRHQLASFKHASYQQALQVWQTPEDINAWIGAKFSYDMSRAMALFETQRNGSRPMAIHPPQQFYTAPSGVCVDLSRFAVETLRHIDPDISPNYLMIEFAPATIEGNTFRLHWLASFRRDGDYYFFADSKRPGHIAGPYANTQAFIDDYTTYRHRHIVAFHELPSYQRKQRTLASKQSREERL